ncbi:MAG: hypothetical protein Q4E05_03870 [Pseudoclavibacter sp.]|nr:hypothetical protein [Pseudoclavibacter sp.]
MIEWLSWLHAGLAAAAGCLCLIAGIAGRKPGDVTSGSLAAVELLLLVQLACAIVAPLAGAPPRGDAVEFWMYLVTAILVPPAAVFWGLVERSRWSTLVLSAAAFTVSVMVVRMQQIWSGTGPYLGG